MKNYLIILITFITIIISLIYLYNYFVSNQKINDNQSEPVKIPTEKTNLRKDYKILDEEIEKNLKYDKSLRSVVIGKIGFKNSKERLPELDNKKIYMPIDGVVKAEKIPADDPLGDLYFTRLIINDSLNSRIIVIWGSFVPVGLNFDREVFKNQGSIIGEFPTIDLEKTQDFFNDFLVIQVLNSKTYEEDFESLKEIFKNIKFD